MAISKTEKDNITDITKQKMWYRDRNGRKAIVVKYDSAYSDPLCQPLDPEYHPIYVCLSGYQPELLIDVLVELEDRRAYKKSVDEGFDISIHDLSSRVTQLEYKSNKHWWNKYVR